MLKPTEKINVNNAKRINPPHKNITFHTFIQIFTTSGNINYVSDEHHMHEYGFLYCSVLTLQSYLKLR